MTKSYSKSGIIKPFAKACHQSKPLVQSSCMQGFKLQHLIAREFTKASQAEFFPQPRLVHYRDRVQQVTILDPWPQERSTLLWVF